jgi:N-acetylglucosamine kinase-like BadF-type ATPase
VRSRDGIVHWAGRVPPGSFAALAPLVCAAAESGDPLAERLVTDGAARLVATLDELGAPAGPVVLAGGLLASRTPVGALVLDVLRGRGTEVHVAHDPAAGAARLAARVAG